MRIRARGSPKAGIGRAQYVSPRKRRGGLRAASSRHATRRGQRRQATTSLAIFRKPSRRTYPREYLPVRVPSARMCPAIARSTSAFVAAAESFNSASSA